MSASLPYRGDGSDRPPEIVVPPDRMPLRREGRPLKRWVYAAAFGERLMVCAGVVRIGPVPQSFWAVWDRERRALREHTLLLPRPRAVSVVAPDATSGSPGRLLVADGTVRAELTVEPGSPVETASEHGPSWIWTRKQGAVRVHGRVELDGEAVELVSRAWEWSAGAGATEAGAGVGWNLVTGVHDAESASERTVWVGGTPHEVGSVRFAEDLGSVAFAEGGELRFSAEAERARRDDLVVFRSDYVQPFGTFAGVLPGAGELAWGRGVMERHSARW
jgi:hypothetical protein